MLTILYIYRHVLCFDKNSLILFVCIKTYSLTFLFVNGISWNFSKTTVSMSLEYMQSFIKIGGVVFEKTRQKKQTDYWIYY